MSMMEKSIVRKERQQEMLAAGVYNIKQNGQKKISMKV